ncbi:unnamed protein product [Spirodela intermedia]|uniref:Uncharacterized protein n=1 Tax=Spirodela intermedia TaxID=51605 RepID=A0A7I8J839_SPIIN|nr:unnamed protein product [Spirodela intermedia]CAA6666386.1 unnamed protein product [Spirodela intermedia]
MSILRLQILAVGGGHPDVSSRSDIGSSSSSAARSKSGVPPRVISREIQRRTGQYYRQIKRQKDYYQILGLRARLHDKNQAPGAEEALQGSGIYDDFLMPMRSLGISSLGGMQQTPTPFGTFRFRTGARGGPAYNDMQGSAGFNTRTLIQLLPVILLLLLNFLPSSEPPYVLSRFILMIKRLETGKGVPYYVKPGKLSENILTGSETMLRLFRIIVGMSCSSNGGDLQIRLHTVTCFGGEAAATATATA